ncbi:hypothetical protein GCM10023100_10480 [Actinocorallia cavernae]|uniref:HNH endonuclease n=2 Tax=Actinomycetes TaxID=1760 RepID=A0ABP8SDK3_9ACTN
MKEPVAPYVTPWTGEMRLPAQVVVTVAGVSYAEPVHDALGRDVDGVLWELRGGTASGRPDYADLHTGRQRETMESFRCAACNRPAARDERGMLWLLPLLDTVPTSWEGVQTAIPPVCEACAQTSPRLCPELRTSHVMLRVREAELIGVRGTLHPRPGEPGLPEPGTVVLYDSPDLPFVVARHAVRELHRITIVSLTGATPSTALSRPRPPARTAGG